MLKKCIRSKKRRSATGPDGVSRQDLMALPEWALQPLVDLFVALENDQCQWPRQLATGIVSELAKGTGDGGPDSYRPITVYPLPYRVWGSCRAKTAIQTLAPVLPSSIRGGVPCQEAKSVWYEVSQLVEQAAFSNTPLNGLMVDIIKAFNNIPRFPLWAALTQLGFPKQILKPWASFLAIQVRKFRIRHSTSKGIGSCTGLPEGDAFSVLGMIVLDWVVEEWIQYHVSCTVDLKLFVDDWQFLFQSTEHFVQLWQALQDVTQELDIQIDEKKSFVWAALK